MIALALLLAIAAPLDRDPAWREAEASYNEFEFEAARLTFEGLARRRGLSDVDRARLKVWIGMCHAEEGALDAAAADFEEAAVVDPDVEALPFMSPKARRMLEDARKRALKRRPAERPKPLPDPEPVDAVDAADVADVPDTVPPVPTPSPPTTISPLVVGGAAVIAVGGIAVVSATIAGVAAQGAAAEAVGLEGAAEASARHAAAEQLALGANVGFLVAGVAVVAGAGLLVAGSLND